MIRLISSSTLAGQALYFIDMLASPTPTVNVLNLPTGRVRLLGLGRFGPLCLTRWPLADLVSGTEGPSRMDIPTRRSAEW